MSDRIRPWIAAGATFIAAHVICSGGLFLISGEGPGAFLRDVLASRWLLILLLALPVVFAAIAFGVARSSNTSTAEWGPAMRLSEGIANLQQLHQSGELTDDEFAKAKAAVSAVYWDNVLDQAWLVMGLVGGLIVAVAVFIGYHGADFWWKVLLVGLAVLAIDTVFGWLCGTFRRFGDHWRWETEREKKLAEEAAAEAAREVASRAEEGRCLKCGGKLVFEFTESGYGYRYCTICGDHKDLSTQYD
jgi:hypothetical protein